MHCLDIETVHVPPQTQQFCQNASVDTEKMYVKCNLHVNIVEREEI